MPRKGQDYVPHARRTCGWLDCSVIRPMRFLYLASITQRCLLHIVLDKINRPTPNSANLTVNQRLTCRQVVRGRVSAPGITVRVRRRQADLALCAGPDVPALTAGSGASIFHSLIIS